MTKLRIVPLMDRSTGEERRDMCLGLMLSKEDVKSYTESLEGCLLLQAWPDDTQTQKP